MRKYATPESLSRYSAGTRLSIGNRTFYKLARGDSWREEHNTWGNRVARPSTSLANSIQSTEKAACKLLGVTPDNELLGPVQMAFIRLHAEGRDGLRGQMQAMYEENRDNPLAEGSLGMRYLAALFAPQDALEPLQLEFRKQELLDLTPLPEDLVVGADNAVKASPSRHRSHP